MTSPQFLIVKIQAILAGRSDASDMQKRSLAMEYYKRCQEAEAQLEHCVALIKAGREYPALQVAESSNLLDALNSLMFPELEEWKAFCLAENLPEPPPFDDSQIELVNSIYTKGVSQNHPLYRDYRRAMRLRKYEEALPIIKTISKINAYDAEARKECDRLRRRVTTKKLAELERAVFQKNDKEISKICESLASERELISDNPIWKEAETYSRSRELEVERTRCAEIIKELDNIDLNADFAKASDLVTEFNVIRDKAEFTKEDLDFIENISREISEKQNKIIATEKAIRAKNAIRMELENPDKKENAKTKISRLRRLEQEAKEVLDTDTAKRLSAILANLSFARRLSILTKCSAVVSLAAVVAIATILVWQNAKEQKRISQAETKLSEIEQIVETGTIAKKISEFEREYPDLANDIFSMRLAALKDTSNLSKINFERFAKSIADMEKINFSTATSSEFDNTTNNLDRLFSDLSSLSPIEQATFREKLENLDKKVRNAIEKRKIKNARDTRKLLEKFDSIAEEYENFTRAKIEIDADAEKITEQLRPLVEDVSATFKAHRLDVDKFNELSVRITDAKNKYAKFDKLRELLTQARNLEDYISSMNILERSGATPSEFARKLSKISKEKDNIKIGQLSDFGSKTAIENIENAGRNIRTTIPENKLITDLYKYSRDGKFYVYTIGEIKEKKHKWQGGSEIIQDVKEITAGGRISTKPYRKHFIDGRSPRGELLVGGAKSAESLLGEAVFEHAAEQSLLSALNLISNASVNSVFKTRLEAIIFEKLKENPTGTLFEYSPIAKKRAEKIDRYAKQLTDYSWIFESNSKEKLLEAELYSQSPANYLADAQMYVNAIKIAKKNPLQFVGVCDEFGKLFIFKEISGAVWGISNENGKFERLAKNIKKSKNKFAPLSPVFVETKSSDKILNEAKSVEITIQ